VEERPVGKNYRAVIFLWPGAGKPVLGWVR
jgi:hypothetical protein